MVMTKFASLAVLALVLALPAQAQQGGMESRQHRITEKIEAHRVRLRDVVERLSPEGQRVFAEAMRAQRDNFVNRSGDLRAIRARIAEAMQAEPFKAEELRKLFARERELAAAEQAKRHDITIEALGKLSPEDRRLFASMMLRGGPHAPPPPPQ